MRRAKLYYLRERSGKSARIREKLRSSADREVLPPVEEAAPAPAAAPEAKA